METSEINFDAKVSRKNVKEASVGETNVDRPSVFEEMLTKFDHLIVGSDEQKRDDIRNLALSNIQALDGHHVLCSGYLSLVLIHYAIGNLLFAGKPAIADAFLGQIVDWLSQQRTVLTRPAAEKSKVP